MDPIIRRALAEPALNAPDEREFVLKARAGDRAARETLINSGLRSVALQAMMLGGRGDRLRDAFQAGTVGLIAAVDRFDPGAGSRLATYAWPWVRGAILAELRGRPTVVAAELNPVDHADESWMWLDGLDPLGAEVICLRFGLEPGTAPLTRQQVSKRMVLTVAQVRKVEAEAMKQLRKRLGNVSPRAPSKSVTSPP